MPAKGTTKREPWNPLLKSYPDSEKINSVSIGAETLFTRLVAKADDYGNYWADPRMLLGGLFKHRWANGEVNVPEMVRWRYELGTSSFGPLIIIYSVNGTDYLHLLNPRRRLRGDIAPDERFPREPENIDELALSGNVPETYRERIENVPETYRYTETETKTKTKKKSFVQKTDEKIYSSAKGKILKGKILEHFEEFLVAFGSRAGKAAAADSWLKLNPMSDDLFAEIIAGAKRYDVLRVSIKQKGNVPKMAQGWLTDRRWEDPVECPTHGKTGQLINQRPMSEYIGEGE